MKFSSILAPLTAVSALYNTSDHSEVMKAKGSTVNKAVEGYVANFGEKSRTGDKEHEALVEKRQSNYMEMVNHFYDLVTDFYQYGWCNSFHFAPRFPGESHLESIRRAEYFLSSRLELKPGMKCVDVGCGVGGPMRNIARFSQAEIIGINNNDYQIKVGTQCNEVEGLSHLCSFQKSDFMHMPFSDNSFDAGFAIEATCHAPDKESIYGEIYRIMKPGALFNCYEWVMTNKYDKNNRVHRAIKEGIEVGNGLPSLVMDHEVIDALKKVGFEVIEYYDANKNMHEKNEIPWYQPLAGGYSSLEGFRKTPIGRSLTTVFVTTLETIGIAPKGSTKVSKLLSDTADDLVKAGKLEIFTPSFYFLVRKPNKVL